MATEFNDDVHFAMFKGAGAYRTGNAFDVRWSEIVLASLRAAGFLDNMVDGTVPPTIDKLWLDKNLDPAVLKEWDPVGANWQQVSNQTLFGRVPWRGAWATSPVYRRADLVSYQGAIWIAVQPSQNRIPVEGAYWNLFLPSLADASVTTPKLVDDSVTNEKLADESVSREKLDDELALSLPVVAQNTMLVDNPAGTARESKTFDQVKALWDPTNDLLLNQGFFLTYHKARGAWPVKAFGNSKTAVGSGTASVDTAALQAGIDAGVPVDITGCDLRANAPIVINTPGCRIGASMSMSRNSSKGARVRVMDPAMGVLWDVRKDNFEISNVLWYGDATTTDVYGFKFERTALEGADIDARILNCASDYLGKVGKIIGRGLKVSDFTMANFQSGIEHDTPASWVQTGATTDLITTGMRGYEYTNIRVHAAGGPAFLNVGANAKNVRGIILANVLADIGSGGATAGGIFKGVAKSCLFSGLKSILNVNAQGSLVQLDPGSQDTDIVGFEISGFKDATTQRLSHNAIVITASLADPVKRIKFSNGKIGPVDRQGILITGAGDVDISLSGVAFERIGLSGSGTNYHPIWINNSMNTVRVKLNSCDFDQTGEGVVTPPATVVGGKNSANVTLIRDAATTKNIVDWALPNVTQVLVAA